MERDQSFFIKLILLLFHLALGVLITSEVITKTYSALIVAFGILYIIKSKNEHNEAIYLSAYMVGAEVLFRMTGGMFFYELPKYSILLFLFIGLLIEKRKHHTPVIYLVYVLLLLVGISFMDIPFRESFRTAIAFNLSGPILLGLSAVYFYRRELHISTVLKALYFMVLPILSMLSLLYFKTPDIKDIAFAGVSNFSASGGYGPNQVSTILGMGVFIFAVHLFFRKRIFLHLFLDIFVFTYLIYRGLVTLSRGGMITAFAAILIFIVFFILSGERKVRNIFKFSALIVFFGVALVVYSSNATQGMLINRYTNKTATGVVKDDVSAGRIILLKSELQAFFDHPFFGVGVGGGKFYRRDTIGKDAPSHNEITRLLGEHGMVGIVILMLLIIVPTKHILSQSLLAKGLLGAFLIFWLLTISHSAMRIAFPAFIYGLSVSIINFNGENSLHRE